MGWGEGNILLNNIGMAHFQSGCRNFVHCATLQNDIFFKLSSFVIVALVFSQFHCLNLFLPRIP